MPDITRLRFLFSGHLVLALLFLCGSQRSLRAQNLAIVKFVNQHHLFASTRAGAAHMLLPHRHIESIQQGVGMAYIRASEGHFLYGVGKSGIVSMRLPVNQVEKVEMAEKIGIIVTSGRTFVFGLGDETFGFQEIELSIAASHLRGRLALLKINGQQHLFAATGSGLLHNAIPYVPTSFALGDSMLITTSVDGTYLYTVSSAGLGGSRISNQLPTGVDLFAREKVRVERELRELGEDPPGSQVELLPPGFEIMD